MGFKVWRVGVGPFGGLRFTIRGLGPLSFGIYSLAVCTEPEQQGLDLQGLFDRIGKF